MKYLDIINTNTFKEMLDVPIGNDRIVKYSPNSIHVLRDIVEDKPIIQSYFWHYPKTKDLLDTILPGLFFKPQLRWNTTIFTTTGLAGEVNSGASATYSVVRAGNNLGTSTGPFYNYFDGSNYSLDRLFTTWDTSSLTTSATITSAFERIVGTGGTTNGDTCTLILVTHTTASNTVLATSDWSNIGNTTLGSVTFAGFATGGNNDITLNGTGLAAISKTTYTKIGARSDKDISNTAPSVDNHITFNAAIGYLSVTYTLPANGGILLMSLI